MPAANSKTETVSLVATITRVFLGCLLLMFTVGCRSGLDQVPPAPEESLVVIAKPGDPVSLDPANVTDLESLQICRNIYDTLVQYKPDSTEIVPGLAESWQRTDDGLEITFKLRKGVVFHDGTPLTAQDVKTNYQRQRDPEHALRSPGDTFFYWSDTWGDRIENIEVLDEHTIRFRFNEPIAPLMQNFAMPFFGIASPRAMEIHGSDYFRHPVGTGPYKFESWLPGERLTLAANERAWHGKPAVERVIFLPIVDSTARALRLRKGSVHIATALSPQGVESLREQPSVRVVEQPGLNVAFLALNNRVEKLSDPLVRQAIWHGVDRAALVRGLYYGSGDVTDTALPKGVWGRKESETRSYDPSKGRELMEKAGYTKDSPMVVSLWYMAVPRSYLPEPKATAEAVARMLEDVNIQVELEPVDWGVYLDRVGRGEHEMALAGWIGDHGDPDNYFSFIFGSANIDDVIGGTNVLFYSNPDVDRLIASARKEIDQQKRVEAYAKIQDEIYEDAPWLPLAHAKQVVGIHPKLKGFRIHPTGVLILGDLHWEGR
jgi:peptide/nickel transport system substrate-binding protein